MKNKGIIVLTMLLFFVPFVLAHGLSLWAYEDEGVVHVEGYTADGRPTKGAKLTIHDEAGNVVALGRTDDEGRYVITPTHPGALRIVLDAGSGHRAEARVEPGQANQQESKPVVAEHVEGHHEADHDSHGGIPFGKAIIGIVVILILTGVYGRMAKQREKRRLAQKLRAEKAARKNREGEG